MKPRVWDKGVCAVALSALLTLGGVGLLDCPTAHAGGPAPAPTSHSPSQASKTALMLQSDDDGDELLEHWSDPKYGREERLQMVGIIGVLIGTGGIAALRRRSARRVYRHG